MDKNTGLIEEGQLNELVHVVTKRHDGSLRIQTDYKYCPTMAEQHTAHLSDINYLMEKMRPDELAQYIAARSQNRQEIIGHDFSNEPSYQEARNHVLKLKDEYEKLPDEIKNNFKNHVEFLKFIDNKDNQEKLIKLGLMTKKEIAKHTDPKTNEPNEKKTDQTQSPKTKESHNTN